MNGRRVFVTGHTGFKGSWLVAWLTRMGAEVSGYSLPENMCDFGYLRARMQAFRPDIVYHLAAQAIVHDGYADPCWTYQTNVIGTVNVLEVARIMDIPVVCVTSDKCYAESQDRRDECAPLWGHDPYSSSKACAELVCSAYRKSYGTHVVTARAGNCIGGGDFAGYRLVPNAIRALKAGKPVIVNDPFAVRPFQHVLEPLHGYILLGRRMLDGGLDGPWNFGPDEEWTVGHLVERLIYHWGSGSWRCPEGDCVHESPILKVDSTKAKTLLGWKPVWTTEEAVRRTVAWYRQAYGTENDITAYEEAL